MESVTEPRPSYLAPPAPLATLTLCCALAALVAGCQPAALPPSTNSPTPRPRVERDVIRPADKTATAAPQATARQDEGELASATEATTTEDEQPTAEAQPSDAKQDHDVPATPAPTGKPAAEEQHAADESRAPIDDLLDNALSGGPRSRPPPVAARPSAPAPLLPKVKKRSAGTGALGPWGSARAGGGHPAARLAGRPGPLQLATPIAPPASEREFNTEGYAHVADNPFHQVSDQPLSTFSIDVDTASYANVRRFLTHGALPPADAVRIEEMINYFSYAYDNPGGSDPFSVHTEVGVAPWNPSHRLVHIGLKGREIADRDVPPRNLVFLLDVSGSMNSPDKLPLLKHGMGLLARQLRPEDRIAIVVYAGASGLVLPPVSGREQGRIHAALERLEAGGGTNGAGGIELAYRVAQEGFIAGGINRVILATDGDFNVGVTSQGELTRLIEHKRRSGVFLTVLGFGTGNVKDSTMELLADKGNGNYAYIDSAREAHKVLVREAGSTLVTIAKDVKLQIEFNPAHVESYRLIGYENRVLAARDFNDDTKDAGEIGAGHTVTALYEVVLRRGETPTSEVDALKYQADRPLTVAADSDELLTVKLRYKHPDAETSKRLATVVRDRGLGLDQASTDFRWSAAVAGFGMLLRGSEHRGNASLDMVMRLAAGALGDDRDGNRHEMLDLMRSAGALGLDRSG